MAAPRLSKNTASEQPRCFGYCRVSTEQQADSGIGLDEQRRKIEARAAEMNWRLEHVMSMPASAARRRSDAGPKGPSCWPR